MTTVTKKELAYRISEKTGLKKVVIKKIIQAFIDEIIDELSQGNRLEFREFGVFEIKTRAARKARNPRTGVRVDVPSKAVVHFKAGRLMKERVQDATEAAERNENERQAAAKPEVQAGERRAHPVATPKPAAGEVAPQIKRVENPTN